MGASFMVQNIGVRSDEYKKADCYYTTSLLSKG
jgi:hypothetical protein